MLNQFVGLFVFGVWFGIYLFESYFGYCFVLIVFGWWVVVSYQEILVVVVRMLKFWLGVISLFCGGVCFGGIIGGCGVKCYFGGVVVIQFVQVLCFSEGYIGSYLWIGC